MQVTDDGLPALQDAVASVEDDVRQVVDDATSEYDQSGRPTAERLRRPCESAVIAALDAPSADTLRAVGSSISALAAAVTGLADDVGSTC